MRSHGCLTQANNWICSSDIARHWPGGNSPSQKFPMRTRISRKVGCPIAAVIRRTCRFLPSTSSNPIQQSGTLLRKRIGGILVGTARCAVRSSQRDDPTSGCGSNSHARHGNVLRPWTKMPFSSFFRLSGDGTRSTCAQYSRSCAWRGCNNRSFHFASSLSNNSPSESASSRPIGYTFFGKPNSASGRFGEPSPVNWDSTP